MIRLVKREREKKRKIKSLREYSKKTKQKKTLNNA